MQRHLFAFSICSPPAATAAEGVASMWIYIAAYVCVCVVLVCACCFECICIPYTFNYYLPCTRCNSSSSSGSRNASTTNKQTAHTKILTKYATHTHTNANPPPTWCFLLAICIKDFYARCKQCQGGLEEMGTAKCAANQCQTWPGQCMQIICVCIIRHKAQKEWEKESERERHESTLCYAATTARATWLG